MSQRVLITAGAAGIGTDTVVCDVIGRFHVTRHAIPHLEQERDAMMSIQSLNVRRPERHRQPHHGTISRLPKRGGRSERALDRILGPNVGSNVGPKVRKKNGRLRSLSHRPP